MTNSETGGGLLPKLYDDLVHPSMVEVGSAVHRAVRLALAPATGAIWTVEQAVAWLEHRVTERVISLKIPPELIAPPSPEILASVVTGVQLRSESEELREMFAALLASAMTPEQGFESHPAFGEVIKQLLPDEARLLRHFASTRRSSAVLDMSYAGEYYPDNERTRRTFSSPVRSGPLATGCSHPDEIMLYAENLSRLGLMRIVAVEVQAPTGIGKGDFAPLIADLERRASKAHLQWADIKTLSGLIINSDSVHRIQPELLAASFVVLTHFGERFLRSCVEPGFFVMPPGHASTV